MLEDKPKKKRFEGLIHFKEALRQAVVCLQASMEARFASSLQSELVRRLDENTDSMHYLLFANCSQGVTGVGNVCEPKEIEQHHILARIYQQQSDDLRNELCCNSPNPSHISVWLDPSDLLITNYFFRLVSLACNGLDRFDLKDCLAWGSILCSQATDCHTAADSFVTDCTKNFGFSRDRTAIMRDFTKALAPFLKSFDSIHLVADGSYIGLLIEGQPIDSFQADIQSVAQQLSSSGAHTIAINCPTDPAACTQFVALTPIRLQSKAVNPYMLKGLVLLNKVRRNPSTQKSKLAS